MEPVTTGLGAAATALKELATAPSFLSRSYSVIASWVATLALASCLAKVTPVGALVEIADFLGAPTSGPLDAEQWLAARHDPLSSAAWFVFVGTWIFSGSIHAPARRAPLTMWVATAVLLQLGSSPALLVVLIAARAAAEAVLERIENATDIRFYDDSYAMTTSVIIAIVMAPVISPLATLYWFVADSTPSAESRPSARRA